MTVCLLGLGANLGNRQQTLDLAVAALNAQVGVQVVAQSRWIETAPVGGPGGQEPFLNGAVLVETTLTPDELLQAIEVIEQQQGRERIERWGARTLDIDVLLYGHRVVNRPDLIVPHPRMTYRRFVLEPAAEIASDLVHPVLGWTIRELLDHLQTAPPYAAITGQGGPRREFARAIAEQSQIELIEEETANETDRPEPVPGSREQAAAAIDRAAARLKSLTRARETRWALSDFWFRQVVEHAVMALAEVERTEIRSYAQQIDRNLTQPKLLVVLSSEEHWTDEDAACSEVIERQSTERPICPTLRVDAANARRAIAEIVAALEAMQ